MTTIVAGTLKALTHRLLTIYMMLCAIWYHSYNLKNVKNTHGRVLLLVKLQAEACNLSKSNTPPWVNFTFFKLYKWYQIAERITYLDVDTKREMLKNHPPFCKWYGKFVWERKLIQLTLFFVLPQKILWRSWYLINFLRCLKKTIFA